MAGGGFTLPEHVEDVLAVLDYLEVGYADLVGHCFGAMIAVRIAAMRPALARRLVLVSGTTRPRDGLRAAVCWGAIGAVGSIFAAVAPRSYHARLQEQFDAAVFSRVSDLYPPRMRQDFRHTSYRNAVATMMAMSRVDLAKDAASLALPVLVVHGRRDVYVPWRNARASAQQIPGSRFVLRETDGHVSCVLGAQSTLARDVAEFLAL